MARIDFLKTVSAGTEKKRRTVAVGKLAIVPVLLGAGAVILLLSGIYLRIANFTNTQALDALDKKTLQAGVSIDKAKALSLQKEAWTNQIDVLNRYLRRDVAWSVKLRQLRQLIPQEVWLTSFSFEVKSAAEKGASDKNTSTLLLRGDLIPSEGVNFLGALSNFVNILKGNEDFYQDFDSLILAKSSSQTYKHVAVMAFEIRLPLKN